MYENQDISVNADGMTASMTAESKLCFEYLLNGRRRRFILEFETATACHAMRAELGRFIHTTIVAQPTHVPLALAHQPAPAPPQLPPAPVPLQLQQFYQPQAAPVAPPTLLVEPMEMEPCPDVAVGGFGTTFPVNAQLLAPMAEAPKQIAPVMLAPPPLPPSKFETSDTHVDSVLRFITAVYFSA